MSDKCQLFNDDCFNVLPTIKDSSVDFICTDPPYNTINAKWETKIDFDKLFEEYWRILKPNGCICMFSQNPLASKIIVSQEKNFRYEWVWEKNIATGFLNSKKMPLRAHELILVFYRSLPTYNGVRLESQRKGVLKERRRVARHSNQVYDYHSVETTYKASPDGSRVPRDVVYFKKVRTAHPTSKPVDLLKYLIQQYTNEGELVLDSFAGGGGIVQACLETNRRFIGIEKDEGYFKLCKENESKFLL